MAAPNHEVNRLASGIDCAVYLVPAWSSISRSHYPPSAPAGKGVRADQPDSPRPFRLCSRPGVSWCSPPSVSQQFLHGPEVVAVLQQVGGKGVPQRVASCGLRYSSLLHRFLPRLLEDGLVKVVPPLGTRARVKVKLRGRKNPIPGPVLRRVRVLAAQRIRQGNSSGAAF
jgi:hypothetical protein